jgi:NAD(P)-dependent dehydrogenase (short-subunit alcohol dehydrogenase family)
MGGPLSGRVAVVAGGSRGIGRGVAESLIRRGASVVICARSEDEVTRAAEELGALGPVRGVRCDVTHATEVGDLVGSTVETFGRLDIAVCCQGVYGDAYSVLDYPEQEWDDVVAINLKGSFLLGQAAGRAMVECGTDAGRIVLISSVDALTAEPNCIAYNASKAALHGLAKGIAVDLGSHGITCNAIAPGWVATPMTAGSLPKGVLDLKEPFELTITGRIGVPADIGEAAAWIADPSSSYVTGSIFVIDGGQTAAAAMPSNYKSADAA